MRLYRKSGFTLIELLIVTAIIGIMAALAVPDVTESIQKIKWRGFATDIQSSLRGARSYAISHQTQYGVHFDTTSHKLIVFEDKVDKGSFRFDAGDSVVRVDSIKVDFDWFWVSFSNSSVCFLPDGCANESGYIDGMCYEEDKYQSLGLSVLAATGRVSIDWIES
jgi:type II secretion system protein H